MKTDTCKTPSAEHYITLAASSKYKYIITSDQHTICDHGTSTKVFSNKIIALVAHAYV
jgi:predicted nucleic acid-binding protein